MDITFYRSRDRADQTIVTRQDGVRLSVPVYGPLDPIPHDLAHFVVERELDLRQGFWASVADGAIYGGMRVLEGRQRPHARERSEALLKANHQHVLWAELLVGATLRAVEGTSLAEAARALDAWIDRVDASSSGITLLKRLAPPTEAMCARWQSIPLGGTLLVEWPDRLARGEHRAPRHRTPRFAARRQVGAR